MKLSIIVPVYNTARTLRRCVESIMAQGLEDDYDYELLLIDDGSTDEECVRLVDELAALNPKFTAYHKPNGGLSSARNYGLDHMTGNCVTFVDSDDELLTLTLYQMVDLMAFSSDYDIVEYPVLQNFRCSDERHFNPGSRVYYDPMQWLAEHGLEHCWAWNKVYRRRLFDDIRFPEDKPYEDIYTLAQLLLLRPCIVTNDMGFYYYYKNDNGIMSHRFDDGLMSLLEAQMSLVKTLGIDTSEPRWHRLYLNMFTSQLHAYRKTGRIVLWPQRIAVKRYGKYNKGILKSLMLNIFGLRLSCKIFKKLSSV